MEETRKLPVKVSYIFIADLDIIFKYGAETFGIRQAGIYENGLFYAPQIQTPGELMNKMIALPGQNNLNLMDEVNFTAREL